MQVFLVIFALVSECLSYTAIHKIKDGCGKFEVRKKCKTICPPQFCNISYTTFGQCNPNLPCISGCDCIKDYLRDNDGICVFNENCPPPRPTTQCGEFEEPTDCADNYPKPSGPDNKCKDLNKCQPGCKCIDKYVRDSNGVCVPTPPSDLKCGINEEPSTCKKECPPQSCDWDPKKYACKAGPCRPGCNCILDYLRDESRNCVPKEQCPSTNEKVEENEEQCCAGISDTKTSPPVPSTGAGTSSGLIISTIRCQTTPPGESPCIYDQCTPTCSIPNPTNCPQISASTTNRCNCAPGYILSEKGGQCVKLEECQKYLNCNGDRNASFTECANRCESTCRKPNAVCSQECPPSGCECNPLYTLSDEGKCILPDDCPGGNPCKENQTFVYCNFGCPTEYCPENDNLGTIACGAPLFCPRGCGCKRNYRRVSYNDDRCVLASDCPPVKCTRPHEVWDPCPPPCFSDRCPDSRQTVGECYGSGEDCQPQCVCEDNYRRNGSSICVPIVECPAVE